LILDLVKGNATRPNKFAKQIIELGEKGLTVSDVIDELKFEIDAADVLSFIDELRKQGIISVSSQPKQQEIASSPCTLDFLWIELTSACNQRCLHCYADSSPRVDEGLSAPEIKRVIDEAAAIGCKAMQFTGGECTLRDDLLELVKHAKSRGFEFVEIFTNGTLLNDDSIRSLAMEKVHVAMSLHGLTDETHDAITGLAGSFDKVMNNLRLLLTYGVPTRCETVAMKQNEDELDAISQFLRALGVQKRPPDPVRPCGRGLSMDNWPKTYGLRSIQDRPCFVASRENYLKGKRGNSCWFGRAVVTSSGDVMPCIAARDQVVGNITQQKLSEVIFGEEMQRLWCISHDQVETCKACEYRYLCGDCRPLAYGFTGNLLAKYPKCTYDPYTGEWKDAADALILTAICKDHSHGTEI